MRTIAAGIVVGMASLSAADARAGLAFNITNQGSASAQMMTGMAQAAALWSARVDTQITINVRINAVALPAGQLGSTGAFFDTYSYTDVRQALLNGAHSVDDLLSTSKLQSAPA